MSIHDFMQMNDGIAEDPEIELNKPSKPRKRKNLNNYKKNIVELKEENDLKDITVPIGREKD